MLPRDNDKIPQDFTKSKEYFLFLKSLNKNIDFTITQHKIFYYNIVEKCYGIRAL